MRRHPARSTGGAVHSPQPPIIRIATPEDAEPLAAFAARQFAETFGPDNRPEDIAAHLADTYGPVRQRDEIADPTMVTLVAEHDRRLAAYAQVCRHEAPPCVGGPDPVELCRFYVDRPWHGSGLAQRLMAAVCEAASGLGGRTLWLSVWERNPRARAFYARYGFRDVGDGVFVVGGDRQSDRILEMPITAPDTARSAAVRVRPATADDAAAIARLHVASWRTAYRGALPDDYLDHLDIGERTRIWQGRLAEPATSVLLHEQDGTLLAFCAMGPTHDADADPATTWEIYNLHVLPDRKRTGIGGALFDMAAARGCEQGRTRLTLWVVRQNEAARRFYEWKGMAPDGGEQTHPLATGARLREVRYAMPLTTERVR